MRTSDFTKFEPFFNADENWGDLERINWLVPWMCYQIRMKLQSQGFDWPMNIHNAFETKGHSDRSYHYKGLAVDFHFVIQYVTLPNQYVQLQQALEELRLTNFVGLGVYPYWNNKGFHLDLRGTSMRWIKVKDDYKYGNYEKIMRLLLENQ